MENIIFGAEFIIGKILVIIAIVAVGFIASIVIGVIVSIIDDAKANKKNKLNMAKEKEIATDVQGLVVTNEIKEALKKVIEFEYYKCWDAMQDRLSDIKNAFNADYVNELTDNMDGLQAEYFKLMDYGIMDLDLDELSCCIPYTEKELIKRYSELQIDEKTLKMIAKMLS